jgi:hypothetical protein
MLFISKNPLCVERDCCVFIHSNDFRQPWKKVFNQSLGYAEKLVNRDLLPSLDTRIS